jgi:membrane protein
MMFKFLPDISLRWRDVLTGAIFTSLLFTLGKMAISIYLGKSGVSSTYGAASSLVLLLVWVYYSSQIFLFGAEFTKAYALHKGSHLEPSSGAMLVMDTPFSLHTPKAAVPTEKQENLAIRKQA